MNKRVGAIEEFVVEDLKEGDSLHCVLCVSGWIDEADGENAFKTQWRHLEMAKEQYTLRYESKYLAELGKAVEYLMSFAVSYAIQHTLMETALAGLMTAIAWPLVLISSASVIDNPWNVCTSRAVEVGEQLAEVLLTRAHGRKRENYQGVIQDVILLGAPVSASSAQWQQISKVVGGRIINGYCESDWLLRFLYRTMSVQFAIAGTAPVQNKGERKIVNYNLSHIVKGHFDYAKKLSECLKAVGVRVSPHSENLAFGPASPVGRSKRKAMGNGTPASSAGRNGAEAKGRGGALLTARPKEEPSETSGIVSEKCTPTTGLQDDLTPSNARRKAPTPPPSEVLHDGVASSVGNAADNNNQKQLTPAKDVKQPAVARKGASPGNTSTKSYAHPRAAVAGADSRAASGQQSPISFPPEVLAEAARGVKKDAQENECFDVAFYMNRIPMRQHDPTKRPSSATQAEQMQEKNADFTIEVIAKQVAPQRDLLTKITVKQQQFVGSGAFSVNVCVHPVTKNTMWSLILELSASSIAIEQSKYIDRHKLIPALYTKLFMYQLICGLWYLEKLSIVHRDIKPENLLIELDVGTKYTQYNTTVDVWAAGCICAEMMTNRIIFYGSDNADQSQKLRECVPGHTIDSSVLKFQHPPSDWLRILRRYNRSANKTSAEFVHAILRYESAQRLRGAAALRHPFFASLRKPKQQLPNGRPLPPLQSPEELV
ncbi:hypothetical protein M3Y99_00847700 [Aphelenchoides fujianensis]|nr:hypothetical protein M3Y99_00847700 [Aphelenchoides fujianensis]